MTTPSTPATPPPPQAARTRDAAGVRAEAREGRAPSSRAGKAARLEVEESTRARGGIGRGAAERAPGPRSSLSSACGSRNSATRDQATKVGAKIGANAPVSRSATPQAPQNIRIVERTGHLRLVSIAVLQAIGARVLERRCYRWRWRLKIPDCAVSAAQIRARRRAREALPDRRRRDDRLADAPTTAATVVAARRRARPSTCCWRRRRAFGAGRQRRAHAPAASPSSAATAAAGWAPTPPGTPGGGLSTAR